MAQVQGCVHGPFDWQFEYAGKANRPNCAVTRPSEGMVKEEYRIAQNFDGGKF